MSNKNIFFVISFSVLFVFIMALLVIKDKETRILPGDVAEEFYKNIFIGDFDEAEDYTDGFSDKQKSVLSKNEEVYKAYFGNFGIKVDDGVDKKDNRAEVNVVINKVDFNEATINAQENYRNDSSRDYKSELINELKSNKTSRVEKEYVINLEKVGVTYRIINDEALNKSLFGMESN